MKNKFNNFFYNITRSVLSVLIIVSVYILYVVFTMSNSPEAALSSYHSFPLMIENILAGITVYLAFSFIFHKILGSSLHDMSI